MAKSAASRFRPHSVANSSLATLGGNESLQQEAADFARTPIDLLCVASKLGLCSDINEDNSVC